MRNILVPLLFSACAFGQPVVTAVVNASGYQPELAPGVVFVIFGTSLGPASLQTAADTNYPESLAGTAITFTPAAGGAPITARMVYTLASSAAGCCLPRLPPERMPRAPASMAKPARRSQCVWWREASVSRR